MVDNAKQNGSVKNPPATPVPSPTGAPAAPAQSSESASEPKEGKAKRRKRRNGSESENGTARYFTGKVIAGALPVFDKEHESEGDAILASHTLGQPFYRVEAFGTRHSIEDGRVILEKGPAIKG